MDIESDPKQVQGNNEDQDNESVSEEIEIAGGDQEEGPIEDSQAEVERIKKLNQDNKKFLQDMAQEENEAESTTARLGFLLKQAEVFAHFVLSRNEKQPQTKAKKAPPKSKRRAHDEKEEDEDLMRAEKEALETGEEGVTRLTMQPSSLKGGSLKDYQMNGLNWMISLYENGINGILADEMGLGKTIQTISLVAFLREFKKITGPFLIIGPKSVLGNWMREFSKWLPSVKVLKLIATKDEREDILKNHLKPGKFDVCLTSYEGINKCKTELKKFQWKYIIIDEAHKIKNEESLLSKNLRDLNTNYKLLLTGTPLQNNLHELWSLLNFLLPELFASSELFDSWFEMTSSNKMTTGNAEDVEKTNLEFITQLHKILKPFLLRRTKAEVAVDLPPKKEVHLFVGLAEAQINLYKNVLSKKSITDDRKFYLNILMQLRKCCNHPYLFEGIEDEGLPALGAHIINTSGKMVILDKLMTKLSSEGGHQVLIFSQMTRMLDILEDYCHFRGYKYCRIDGDTDMDSRDRQIVDFTTPNSEKFIFLLSTRAGGLGINLATADTVILYDSDWNPQADLQAMDRAHRIGQKKIVNVYRLITENTVEEKIVERQQIKLKWDSLVIQQTRQQSKNKVFTREELKNVIQYGASEIFRSSGNITDEDIDVLLARGEKKTTDQTSKLEKIFKKEEKNLLDLAMNDLNYYKFEDVDYQKMKRDEEAVNEAYFATVDSDLRTRREKNLINVTKGDKEEKKKIVIKLPEYQFFTNRERLVELLTKQGEWDQNRKPKSSNQDEEGMQEEDSVEKQKEKELQENRGLTNEENKEKSKLLESGFLDWNKDEYLSFIKACEKYGRSDYMKISEHIGTKDPQDVEKYSKVLFVRINELPESQKHLRNIERGEAQIASKNQARDLINWKCGLYKNAKEEMEFNPTHYNKSRSKFYSIEHDKFLVYISYLEGYGHWEKIRRKIKEESLFRFDHFFKSRSEPDLNKRMQSLLKVLEKEKETQASNAGKEEATTGRGGKSKRAAATAAIVIPEDDEEESTLKKADEGKKKGKKEKAEKTGSASKKDRKEEDKAPEDDEEKQAQRYERYKERQMKKEQAIIDKLTEETDPQSASKKGKAKDSKKMKQSTLSFGKKADNEGSDKSDSGSGSKKRKMDEEDANNEEDGHVLKASKVTDDQE